MRTFIVWIIWWTLFFLGPKIIDFAQWLSGNVGIAIFIAYLFVMSLGFPMMFDPWL